MQISNTRKSGRKYGVANRDVGVSENFFALASIIIYRRNKIAMTF